MIHTQYPGQMSVDRVGNAKFVSKFDLLKGYWQVPLSVKPKRFLLSLLQTAYTNTK